MCNKTHPTLVEILGLKSLFFSEGKLGLMFSECNIFFLAS